MCRTQARWAEEGASKHEEAGDKNEGAGEMGTSKTKAGEAAERASEKLAQDSWGMGSAAVWGDDGDAQEWGAPAACALGVGAGTQDALKMDGAGGAEAAHQDWGDGEQDDGWGAKACDGGAAAAAGHDAISDELQLLQLKAQHKLQAASSGAAAAWCAARPFPPRPLTV